MTRHILLVILWGIILAVAGSTTLTGQQDLKIVASASMLSDIAQNIVGDLHPVEMIVPIGGDPHLHEPTPRDARLVAGADLVLVNGLTFEGWINELIDNSGTQAKVVTVSQGADVLTSLNYSNSTDPHAWMDADNGKVYAQNMAKAISEIDPQHKDQYAANLKSYTQRLTTLDEEIKTKIATIPKDKRVLVTSHDAFQYYGRKYGLQLEAIMGISTEADAQTSDITRVTGAIRKYGVPAIFIESTINPKLIQQIAKDNGVSVGGSLYADSLGEPDSPGGTYIDMLRYNTNTIVSALTGTAVAQDHVHERESKSSSSFLLVLGGLLFLGLGILIYIVNRR